MSEISRAMDKSRREHGRDGDVGRPSPRVLSPLLTRGVTHGDAEQYLALASEISMALPSRKSRVILIASAVGGEGTSTIAREFALVVAERGDARTVLIDANLRQPSVHEAFRVRRDPGLTDHILGGAPLGDCVVETSAPRLSVVPSGRPVIAPPRVAGDPRIAGMLDELRKSYSFIVVDSPPVLSYSEAVQLSAVSDGVVTVIRSGHTRRQLHARALDMLEEAGANVLGTVLNRRRFYIPKFIYDRI